MQTTQVDYRNGPLFPMILRFSIPAAISLLITAVYNIVDRIFVGNWVGTSALAGLSVCFPLSYMMMAFGLMCSAGGSTCFSLFSGQGETRRMNRAFGNAFVLVCAFELLLSAFLLLFTDPLLGLFGVTGIGALTNIVLDAVFIIGFHWGGGWGRPGHRHRPVPLRRLRGLSGAGGAIPWSKSPRTSSASRSG